MPMYYTLIKKIKNILQIDFSKKKCLFTKLFLIILNEKIICEITWFGSFNLLYTFKYT